MKRILVFGVFVLLLAGLVACAKSPAGPEDRVKHLGSQVRCPVCRGVPISESPSTLAAQMMDVVREQVAAGKSDDEVLKYFEDRYGEWVLLQPKPEGMNLVIWVLPAFVLVGGGAGILMQLRKRRGQSSAAPAKGN